VSKQAETFRQAIIDEFGEADRQARLWTPSVNPHLARRAELAAIIESWYASAPPETSETLDGRSYRLEVKPCQYQRKLTPVVFLEAFKRLKKLKLDPFAVFTATQEALRKYLGEPFLDEFAPKERTGRRTFDVVAKAAPQLSKAA